MSQIWFFPTAFDDTGRYEIYLTAQVSEKRATPSKVDFEASYTPQRECLDSKRRPYPGLWGCETL